MSEEANDAIVDDTVEMEADAEIEAVEVEETVDEEVNESESSTEESKGVQKRIGELTKARRTEERQRIAAENEARYWREQAEKAPPPEATPLAKTLADFEYDEAAFAEYAREEIRQDVIRQAEARSHQNYAQQKQQAFLKQEGEFADEHDDYNDVTRVQLKALSSEMLRVVQDSENAPSLLYYLGKNPTIAEQLYRLPPLQMAREMGRVEAGLKAIPKGESISKAPTPPPAIKAANSVVKKDPVDMTQAEFEKMRRKVIANR